MSNKSVNTKFSTNGSQVDVVSLNPDTIKDKLAPKVYSVRFSDQKGFYLEIVRDRFDIPAKIYGEHPGRVDKILNTYKERSKSTGIVLSGDKGTGKSLILELVCNRAIDSGTPVVTVNQAFSGDSFLQFIDMLGDVVLVFDEFDKCYSSSVSDPYEDEPGSANTTPQESLLTLLEGLYSRKRLVLFSANDDYRINDFFKNRPGRIYYYMKFSKLSDSVVKEYCKDKNVPKNVIDDILDLRSVSRLFSFDILQALVEEYLRFKPAKLEAVLADLNVDLSFRYDISIVKVLDKKTKKQVSFTLNDDFNVNTPEQGHFSFKVGKTYEQRVWLNNQEITRNDDVCCYTDAKYICYFKIIPQKQENFMRHFAF